MFKHCDPAGIVFYPRYFEMINDCVETFFDRVLAMPFDMVHADAAVPTVQISTHFTAPSRLGDVIDIALMVTKIGTTSMDLNIRADCCDQPRFTTVSTLVYVDGAGRSQPWPDRVKHMILTSLEDDDAA